ncbi:MAG: hypothetical protein ACPGSB_12305 [Opitutales bacterium]
MMKGRLPTESTLEAELSRPARAIRDTPEQLSSNILRQVRSEWPEPKRRLGWVPILAFATVACALALFLLSPDEPSPLPVAAPDIAPALASIPESLTGPYAELYASVGEDLDELGNFLSDRVSFVGGLMPEG